MRPIRHVLVPVDFSDLARNAFAHGAAIARRFDARLTALYVSPFYAPPEHWRTLSIPPLDLDRRRALEKELREFASSSGASSAEANTIVREGDPAREVLSYASAAHVDLVVLGTHGRRGFQRWVVGSVTNRVTRNADCMVLVVPPGAAAKDSPRVLCAVDLTESSDETIERAAAFARSMSAHLTVFHVVDGPHGYEPWVLTGQTHEQARAALVETARESLEKRTARHAWGSLTAAVHVVAGEPRNEIERALAGGFDLAVLGVRPSSGIDRFFFGSTAQHVLHGTLRPVLLVPHTSARTGHPAMEATGVGASS